MGEKIDEKKRLVLVLVLACFLVLLSSCTAPSETAKQGCDISGTYLECDKWSVCADNVRERTCRDLLGCLEISSFKETQDCEISVKTGELKTGPAIADFCNNDDVCDKIENFHLCPKDCSANAIDGLCNDATNNICDPDCGVSDKDCVPDISSFTTEMSINFSQEKNIASVRNLELGIKNIGSIRFNGKLDLLGLNLNEEVSIVKNKVSYTSMLNTSADITLFSLDLEKPAILFKDSLCKSCKIRSFKNGTLKFTVPGPGEYSAKETSELTTDEKEKAKVQDEGSKFYKTKKFTIIMIILLAILIVFGAFYTFFKNITFHIHMPKHEEKEIKEKKVSPPPLIEIKPYLPEKEEKRGKKEKKGKGKKKGKKHRDERIETRRVVRAKARSIKIVKRPPKNPHKVVEVKPRPKKKKGRGKVSSKTLLRIKYHPQKAKSMFKEGVKVVKQKDKEYEKRLKEQIQKQKEHEKLMKKKGKQRKPTKKKSKTKKQKTAKRRKVVKKKAKRASKNIKKASKKNKKYAKKSNKKKPKKKRKR
ncbi:hypothetical protein KY326_01295 [Candidatus Woesearchaeota archaeon]|nr:hypothetical protein [Candidatus Woesearchaeota archaeon]